MNSNTQGAFRALSDPTRRQILMHLAEADMTIAEVASRFEITRGAVKKHTRQKLTCNSVLITHLSKKHLMEAPISCAGEASLK